MDITHYFPPEHPANISIINNQALLYKISGRYHEAKEMFETVVQAYTEIYGEVHQSTINSMINLATVHKDLKEFDLAAAIYEKAIEGRRQTEGENSVNYAMALAMAAGGYRELGQHDKSEKYLKDAYLVIALEHGEENLAASAILNSMGLLYKRQEKFERSVDAYTRSLKVREDLLGEDHPETLSTRHNLGELYIAWNKPERAQELLNKNIELMEKKSEQQREAIKQAQKNKADL